MFASVIGSASIKYAYLIHGSSYRSHTVLSSIAPLGQLGGSP